MASDISALLDAIGILADWEHHPPIRANLRTTRHGATTLSTIVVVPEREEWTVTNADEDYVERRDAAGIYTLTAGRKELERGPRSGHRVPPALWLVFPMSAFIWGRPRDRWKMVSAERNGGVTDIRLIHTEIPEFEATITVDHELRLATKFVSNYETFELFDVV